MRTLYFFFFFCLIGLLYSCDPETGNDDDLSYIQFKPESYTFNLPKHFPQMFIPADNPMTKQGINLGKHLFYDPILSGDSTMACASCHLPEFGFSDSRAFSLGIDGKPGTRHSMSLINVGFSHVGLFWDGCSKTLEDQALLPVEDPLELNTTWPSVIQKLKAHPKYPTMFREAFGINDKSEITKELAAKAIAQFERTIISTDSKFDRVMAGKELYTDLELIGFGLFFDDDPDLPDMECGHCHNIPLATSDEFFNNGLTFTGESLDGFPDLGRGKVTGSKADNGKFKAPTLRNIKYTAPYMHDGRFKTLDEVLDFYATGGQKSPNKDKNLHKLEMTPFNKRALLDFIDTFTDTVFYKKPELQNPFK